MGNFDEAVRNPDRRARIVVCPHCTNDDQDMLEFQSGIWICKCCSRTFRPPDTAPRSPDTGG